MNCSKCGCALKFLFFSSYCPRCESNTSAPITTSGYIVWRARPPGSCECVFKTRHDAERWRSAAGLDRFPVREVRTPQEIKWRMSTGSVRDIELADRFYEIYPANVDQLGPNSAWLV